MTLIVSTSLQNNSHMIIRCITTTGAYTAGAIASIAFKRNVPVVDGNVIRFLARIRAVRLEAKDRTLSKACWQGAAQLVHGTARPGDLNQAMMELGAVCCTPKNPTCTSCPVRDSCLAFAQNPQTVTRFPLPATKKVTPEYNVGVLVIVRPSKLRDAGAGAKASQKRKPGASSDNDEYLMWKRPSTGLLAGQWEFACSVLDDKDIVTTGGKSKANKGRVHVKPAVVRRVVLEQVKRRASVCVDGSGYDDAAGCQSCRALADGTKAPTPAYVDTFTHVFSHVKHKMLVHTCELGCMCASPALGGATSASDEGEQNSGGLQWMTAARMAEVGVTKQITQVLGLVQKFHRTPRLSFGSSEPSMAETCTDSVDVVVGVNDASGERATSTRTRRPRVCKVESGQSKSSKKAKVT
jgi:adenine-specific DNA glycosylase